MEQTKLDPNMREACLAIVDLLSEVSSGDGYHLGLRFFSSRLHDSIQPFLLPALSILSTMETPILSMHGYLDSDDGQHHLEDEDFRELLQSGKLAHPTTGELISDPFGRVRIFYSIRDEVRNVS
ncbi:hypothetical protein [uncultured Aliiroseovarius sp.]|uniref:hypothetical protein n=1 Tax=uncultured Aliiroseovarius sp. TaxID=1658783 RepID=UPI00262FB540|nr:hypothetical protein [uncultured Aliiroseovarius sp.]